MELKELFVQLEEHRHAMRRRRAERLKESQGRERERSRRLVIDDGRHCERASATRVTPAAVKVTDPGHSNYGVPRSYK